MLGVVAKRPGLASRSSITDVLANHLSATDIFDNLVLSFIT